MNLRMNLPAPLEVIEGLPRLEDDEDVIALEPGQVKILDLIDQGVVGHARGNLSEERFRVQIGDAVLWYEVWFTDNSGGDQWYTDEGEPADLDTSEYEVGGEDFDSFFERLRQAAADAYYERYAETVKPAIAAVKESVFPFVSP